MRRVVLLVLTAMFGGALLLQSCEKESFGPNGNPSENDTTYVDPNDTIYNGGGNGGNDTLNGGGGNPVDTINWGGGNNGGGNNGGDTIIWGGGGNPNDTLGG